MTGIRAGMALVGSVLALLATGAAGASAADFIAPNNDPPTADDGWQAGTCTTDTPQCDPTTTGQFFTQAAGHPNVGITQFIVDTDALGLPVESIKDVRVDLPAGLSVNSNAVPQCPVAEFEAAPTNCAGSELGTSFVTAVVVPPAQVTLPFTVYNLEPPPGVPLLNGFSPLPGQFVYIVGGVAWDSDYHEFFSISDISNLLPIVKNRLVFNGQAGMGPGLGGPFLTNPSTCFDPSQPGFEHIYSTLFAADSYQSTAPVPPDAPTFRAQAPSAREAILPPGVKPTGCDAVPFDPAIAVTPGTDQTDSPAGGSFDVGVPFDPDAALANSHVKDAQVTLPAGMGLNPAAADGLQACTDAQLGKGTTNPVACPAASRVGSVEIHSPALPGNDPQLSGDVFIGEQQSRDPESGNQFRIFVDAESPRFGLSIRLVGHVRANAATGRLTAVFNDLPQLPFDSFKLTFDGGPKATLTSPPTCGPHGVTSAFTPYSGTADATPSDSFTLTNAPGGGSCPQGLGDRAFTPTYGANTTNHDGGAFTHFVIDISRAQGQQELKGVTVNLPPGLVAKLAGVDECSDASIAAAANRSGAAELGSPSCPASSRLGSVDIKAGSGSQPLPISGDVYLAGPYKGAPFSLAFITPAVAGPYDLGTVVVRVALFFNPDTAQVQAVSDPIPHLFGGVILDLRSIDVNIDRPGFMLNPTNCDAKAVTGNLFGGGADPSNTGAFVASPFSTPLQVANCERLGFRPRIFLRLFGRRHDFRRNGHPRLRAVVIPRNGQANIGRVAVTLPKSVQLDQSHIRRPCTRPEFAANACAPASIYGSARAFSPLLDAPLRGPVYLRTGDNPLPDLVAKLRGQVGVNLVGRTDTNRRGQLRNTFDTVPDVPVTKFILVLKRGRKGLIVPNRNLCGRHRGKATVNMRGQNGKKARGKVKLRTPCRKKHRRHRQRHR